MRSISLSASLTTLVARVILFFSASQSSRTADSGIFGAHPDGVTQTQAEVQSCT